LILSIFSSRHSECVVSMSIALYSLSFDGAEHTARVLYTMRVVSGTV
jgi:hypothetical protein